MFILEYFLDNKLELFATIMGILCVYLNVKENIWAWPIGILSVGSYVYIFWQAKLVSDGILHVIYVILGFYGWYNWLYGGEKQASIAITATPREQTLKLLLIGFITTAIWGWVVVQARPDASLPYLDATALVFSLIAQWLLIKKKIENWLFWIGVDVLSVGIYAYKALYITAGLYTIYLFLAIWGYFNWKKLMQTVQ